ncbi:hypothetical protein EHO61_11960 [Leptospira fluminis]|uniref:Uncharacterized protein n=1 Tax=Leptospira fluminis TaxID=2484979 RepID=A0A4R9GLR0_9LEPT|nr:hypothetical protein [Leptospira fluminis]TGK17134.1 hypothetical protein EHO61_11960 [Leptospira fluminis]
MRIPLSGFLPILKAFALCFLLWRLVFVSNLNAQVAPDQSPASKWDDMIQEYTSESLADKQKRKDTAEEKYRTKYFSVNIGLGFSHATGSVRRHDYVALQTQGHYVKPNLFLELKSRDLALAEYFGVQLLSHTTTFSFDNQEMDSIPDNVSATNYGLDNFINTRLQNRTKREDVGTNANGYYSILLPAFFWGRPNSDGFRFGGGVGVSVVNESGDMYIKNRYQPLIASLSADPSTGFHSSAYIQTLTAYNILSGVVDLPVQSAFLLNSQKLDTPTLAAFLMAQGYSPRKSDLITYENLVNFWGVDPMTALVLSVYPKKKIQQKNAIGTGFMLFFETPMVYGLKGKMTLGIPSFSADHGFKADIVNVSFTLYYPIQF